MNKELCEMMNTVKQTVGALTDAYPAPLKVLIGYREEPNTYAFVRTYSVAPPYVPASGRFVDVQINPDEGEGHYPVLALFAPSMPSEENPTVAVAEAISYTFDQVTMLSHHIVDYIVDGTLPTLPTLLN
jgi:hypothetical protein